MQVTSISSHLPAVKRQNQNQQSPSFEGKGTLIMQNHKYTDEIGLKIRQEIEPVLGKIGTDIREFLLKNKFIDKEGNLIKKAPKTVVIEDGKETFDESLIDGADFILQKGGQLEKPVSAKTFELHKGTHAGITTENLKLINYKNDDMAQQITTTNLDAINSELTSNIKVKNETVLIDSTINAPQDNKFTTAYAKLKGNSSANNMNVAKTLETDDDSVVTNSSAEFAYIYGQLGDNLNVKETLHSSGEAVVTNSSAKKADIYGKSADNLNIEEVFTGFCGIFSNIKASKLFFRAGSLSGNIQGEIKEIPKYLKIAKDTKFDETARKSLPIRRFREKYFKSYSLNKAQNK